jgi:hypothetical protein
MQNMLMSMASIIKEQQGYLLLTEDVRVSLSYICRSFVPRKKLSNPLLAKKAAKFLQSVKEYINDTFGLDFPTGRFKNLSKNYTFLDDFKMERKPAKDIIEINDPENLIKATYKKKTVVDFDLGDTYNKQLIKRRVIVANMTKGRKYVDASVYVRPVLKKKYKDKDSLNTDLYSLYLSWLDSKIHTRELFCELRSVTIDNLYLDSDNYPTNKAWRKHFLTKDLFCEYLDTSLSHIPKRFWRILRFCKAAKDSKSVKLDTVSESIYTQVVVKDADKESNAFKLKALRELYSYTMNPRVKAWATQMAKGLTKMGYYRGESHVFIYDFKAETNLIYKPPGRKNREFNKIRAKLVTRIARDFLGRFLDIMAFDDFDGLLCSLGGRTLLNPTFDDVIGVLSYLGLTHELEPVTSAAKKAINSVGSDIKRKVWKYSDDLEFAQKLQNHALSLGYLKKEDIYLEEDVEMLTPATKRKSSPYLKMNYLPMVGLMAEPDTESNRTEDDNQLECMHRFVNHFLDCNICQTRPELCKGLIYIARDYIMKEDLSRVSKTDIVYSIEEYLDSETD